MAKEDPLGGYAEDFLTKYLAQERGCPGNTIVSYFTCIKLLFLFCCQHLKKKVEKLHLKDLDAKMVLAFLDYLETDRENLPQTRNVRLGCIHSFFRYVALQDPTMLEVTTRICAIKPKKVAQKVLPSLTHEQVDAIIGAIEPHDLWGLRDHAVHLLLYNTGARVSEIVNLKIDDLHMEEPYYVSLTGKGNKQRYVPIWDKTVVAIKLYLDHRNQRYLFRFDGAVTTRICAIKPKKVAQKVLPSLTHEQVDAIIGAIEPHDLWGLRDHAVHLLLYNTGARVSEIVNLKIDDLHMEEPYYVSLTGKGNKQRYVPIWDKTVVAIKLYLDHRNQRYHQPTLILNQKGKPISRFGIAHIVKKYHELAQVQCPSLGEINVTPHTFRHTCALHNVEAGNADTVVRDHLGHANVKTTQAYYRISMEMKRKALESFHPPKDVSTPDSLSSPFYKPGLLERLEKMCHPSGAGAGTQARPRSGPC